MEKKELTNGIVEVDGIKTVAERTVDDYEVTYKPNKNYHKGLTVEQVVYDLMTIAAHDMLNWGTTVYAGEYTAAEMAGKVGYLYQFAGGEDYKIIRIKTETFCCSYHAGEAFAQMAEWEGVMNMAPKKYHRFAVEGKEMPSGVKLKPYTRCHGCKPKTISLAAENDRIAKKFEVIGKMAQSLTSDGMRRALSVIEAAYFWDKHLDLRDMARRAMEFKLWKDYGKDDNRMPVHFSKQDFQPGPEIWKQVDKDYVIELRRHFQQMLDSSPAPKWPEQGDVVMLKGRENMAKKYQGKFLCEGLVAMLSTYGDRIEWRASVRTKKYDCEYFYPAQLEPAPEVKPKGKTKAASKREQNGTRSSSAEREQARPKVKTKKKTAAPKKNLKPETKSEPTIEERLRAALRKQFAMAA